MKKYIYVMALAALVGCARPMVGPPGIAGSSGVMGTQGHSAVFFSLVANESQCPNGGSILLAGIDSNDNGLLDSRDSGIQTLVVCNGLTGQSGQSGKDAPISPMTPVAYITPCGPNSSPFKEVLLLMGDGSVLASFSNTQAGYNTRFAFIPDGTFQDTDSSNCIFTLSTSGETRSISWHGGGQTWHVSTQP